MMRIGKRGNCITHASLCCFVHERMIDKDSDSTGFTVSKFICENVSISQEVKTIGYSWLLRQESNCDLIETCCHEAMGNSLFIPVLEMQPPCQWHSSGQ